MQQKSKSMLWWLFGFFLILLLLPPAWYVFDFPMSFNEALFRLRLSEIAKEKKKEFRLADIATFDWAEVCNHHGYDGIFRYGKYRRAYEAPFRANQDGIWSLLFIKSNGDPTYVVGSCQRGGAYIYDFDCVSREEAIFVLSESSGCPEVRRKDHSDALIDRRGK